MMSNRRVLTSTFRDTFTKHYNNTHEYSRVSNAVNPNQHVDFTAAFTSSHPLRKFDA